MGMCLNKRVLIGLGVVALGVLTVAPRLLGAAGPLLLFAVCPLSMVFMMRGMSMSRRAESGMRDAGVPTPTARSEGPAATSPSPSAATSTGADRDADLRGLQEEVSRLKAEVQRRSPSPSV